ncbi:MAG: diphosphomevalonate decarboxylase [Saprospiraceae bacterium]
MTLSSSWRSPSNIALIKYWGKHGMQLPNNPSLSFTLSACHTDMKIQVMPESSKPSLTVLYDGSERRSFEPKINAFFQRIYDQFSWLINADVIIDSTNTFPHGAGIASSASAMSALALCLLDIDDQIHQVPKVSNTAWWTRASGLARIGSGSAARSVFPVAALWGETNGIKESSDAFAIPWTDHVSGLFRDYQDTILIVSSEEKTISSSVGHELMSDHVHAETRYAVARKNLDALIAALGSEGSVDHFISICESEALQLHALMMAGSTPYILIGPETISIIKEVWRFRKETGIPVCFTLDAGPNVHLLYPASFKDPIHSWIKTKLAGYCADGFFILDVVGGGPERIL